MIERTISKHIAKALEAFSVIVITGAKQVGDMLSPLIEVGAS